MFQSIFFYGRGRTALPPVHIPPVSSAVAAERELFKARTGDKLTEGVKANRGTREMLDDLVERINAQGR